MSINTSIVSALKDLAAKLKGSGTASDIPGHSVSEVIAEIGGNYSEPKTVTALTLTKDSSGVLTSGKITFSDDTTADVTVETAETAEP